jgi:DNA modification methylase
VSRVTVYSDNTRRWRLVEADALDTLARLPGSCIDAVVTDPPYGIALGGEAWDRFGTGGSTAEAFENWSSRWAAEAARVLKPGGHLLAFGSPRTFHRLVAGIEDAGLEVRDQLLWLYAQGMPKSPRLPGGLGTLLKPAYEPILIARKPLAGTTTDNLQRFGTGALNIEAARVGGASGYWPANVAASHSPDCPVALLDGERIGPSRLFFCAKATKREREAGCEQLPQRSAQLYTGTGRAARERRNTHPTVKPVELMRWLVRLAVPEDGVVLDPFAGSASTGIAAVMEGRRFLGIERESEYVDIACARLSHWAAERELR